jgi:ketosteroid isomerase-like protein
MRRFFPLVLLITALPALVPTSLAAQTNSDEAAIRAMMDKQVEDWNRGDIDAFAAGYKNAPDILFMGDKIQHGYADMLAHDKARYASRAKMGTLAFSGFEVQPLDDRFATATGRFHLVRARADGGEAGGFYLLVLEKTPDGWKIIRDDTTAQPMPAAK